MDITGKVLLGKVGKPHGLKGHIRVNLSKDIKELLQPEALFILQNDNLLPYFITDMETRDNGEVLLAFEDVDSPEKARKLTGLKIYAMENVVTLEENDLHELVGYRLLNAEAAVIGQVVDVLDFPAHVMMEVEISSQEDNSLVPLVESWVIGIDHSTRQLQMELPEGLIEAQEIQGAKPDSEAPQEESEDED